MRYASEIEIRGPAPMPDFQGDRIYMLPFTQREGLTGPASRWQATVDAMLDGVVTDGPIYLMVDEAFVAAGTFHRRPGVHIDGYWLGDHAPEPTHGPRDLPVHRPTWAPRRQWGSMRTGHGPSPYDRGHGASPPRRHSPGPPGHGSGGVSWSSATFEAHEAILLASSVSSAVGYRGVFEGPIGDMGDCSGVDVSSLERVAFPAGLTVAGNVTALHETVPCAADCHRQLVRLNVPGVRI